MTKAKDIQKKRITSLLVVLVVVIVLVWLVTGTSNKPTTGPDLPLGYSPDVAGSVEEYRSISGVWKGVWNPNRAADEQLIATLAISNIQSDGSFVGQYAVGSLPKYEVVPTQIEISGRVSLRPIGAILLEPEGFPENSIVHFIILGDTLQGYFDINGFVTHGEFSKVQ